MDIEFLRYSCQIALPDFNESTQKELQQSKVLIVGAGGLGCPAAQYLTATGIGTIGITDFDVISISNLHRQILYTKHEVGLKKAFVACKKLQSQNESVKLIPYEVKITSENVIDIISSYDIVVDASDNFETKYLLNDACVLTGKPLVYGAIYQYEGQVSVWNFLNSDGTRSPNYRDIFPSVNATQIPDCAEGGVLPTLAGIIGSIQATEAIKYLTKTGELLSGKILMFDARTMQSRIIKLPAISATNIQSLEKSETIPVISIELFKKEMDKNLYELIDVRNKEEHDLFNIGGKNISLDKILDEELMNVTDKPLIFYCASGKRSDEAVKIIMKKNPSINAFSLTGGIKAWKENL